MKSLVALVLIFCPFGFKAQVCDPNGNIFILTGFTGDFVQLNIDVDIPNLKIGICSYNAIAVQITGPFVDQISEIVYAGAGVSNGGACGFLIDSVQILGFPEEAIKLYDLSRGKIGFTRKLGDQAPFLPFPTANCLFGPKSACGAPGEEQNNSEAQIAQFFLDEFGEESSIYAHHYEPICLSGIINLSEAGNCCETEDNNPLNPIYETNHTYHFFENDTIELCSPTITLDVGSYFFPVLNPEFPGVVWNTGATGPIIEVSQLGEYSFTAVDLCSFLANTFLSDTIRVVQCCSLFDDLVISPSIGDTVCIGQEVVLTTNYNNVTWSDGQTIPSIVVNENFTASASTFVEGCLKTDVLEINFIDPPVLTLLDQNPICPDINTYIFASGAQRFLWENGTTQDSVIVLGQEDFQISLQGSIGECFTDTIFSIEVYPFTEFSLGEDVSLDFPEFVTITPNQPISEIELLSDFPFECDDCEFINIYAQNSGLIIGKFIDEFGCPYHDNLRIDLNFECNQIYIPNAFSPDEDIYNEEFCFYSECTENVDFKVYNRLGTLIYESKDPKLCWDGTFKEKLLGPDYYLYQLNVVFKDGSSQNLNGHITLLR